MTSRAHTPHTRRISLVAVALVLIVSACGGSSSDGAAPSQATVESTGSIRVLAPDDFSAYLDQHPDAPLINVHVPYEGHIEGTDDFVPFDQIGDWDGLPQDKTAPLVLYCRSGNMSATASETLSAMGYTDIVDLAGGMQAWTAAGKDLIDEEPAPG